MMPISLTDEEKKLLLKLARQTLTKVVNRQPAPPLDLATMSDLLQQPGASFVTLTKGGELRGCIGTLEPYQPLVEDVCEHAQQSALHDFRFSPVRPEEVPFIRIEISRLTLPQPLDYSSPEDLLAKLRPGVDGVILYDGSRRATFLPQVWDQLPDPVTFLNHLCQKMGTQIDLWRRKPLQVMIYQVEEFHE